MASVGLGMNVMISRRTGGRRWVDQSPTYTAMLDVIPSLFPEALFIHIMRDGRNVVQSMISSGFSTPWATDFEEACRTWAWFVDQAVAFAAQEPDRCLAVPYEFLSESPRECFAGILEFLDAEFAEQPAEFIRTRRINSSYQADGPRSETYLGPKSPWDDWSKQQRKAFVELAGHSFVENRFGRETELAVR